MKIALATVLSAIALALGSGSASSDLRVDAPELVPSTLPNAAMVEPDLAVHLNLCPEGTVGYGAPVFYSRDGATLYGDQDENDLIDGEDCHWS